MAAFKKRSAELVAISVDELDDGYDLAKDLGLTFPLLSDPKLAIISSYGVEDPGNGISWPAIFIIAADGTIAWKHVVNDYRKRPDVSRVLNALDDAIDGEN